MSKEILEADFIPVNLDNVINPQGESLLKFDEDYFDSGFQEGSFFAGMATALFNCGLEEESVASLIETWMMEYGSNKENN